ncbi:TniQ protein [Paraburkholderia sp. BL6665CI2N2]|nr:TniQ protein [Paraburkholderia sp. BL6665CI2N2]
MLPSRMGPVINLLERNVGTVEEVVKHNMLIPLASRFIPLEDTESIVSHFIEGPKNGLASKVGMAGQASGWSKHRLLRCPKCLKEDIGSCGKPFWRRDHLLPGILFCGKHRMPLHVPCDICADYARFPDRTLHAGHHCGCGLKPLPEATLLSDAQSEVEIELARVASRLLNPEYLPQLDFRAVAKETNSAATELGLIEDGELRYSMTKEFLLASPFNSLLRRTGFLSFGGNAFAQILKGYKSLRHPISAIATLISLAGSWQKVEERLSAPRDAGKDIASANHILQVVGSARVIERSANRIASDLNRYKMLCAAHPGLTHTQLKRRFSNSAQRYLTVRRLIAAGIDVAARAKEAQIAVDARMVDEVISHIKQRLLHLRDAGYPRQITPIALMETFRRPRLFAQRAMQTRLSRAYETLQRHAESVPAWRERVKATAAMAEEHGERVKRSPMTTQTNKSTDDQECEYET